MGGSGLPTYVQTPSEISAYPLKNEKFFIYRGIPCMYIVYCKFYCSPAKKNGSDPHTFFGLVTTLAGCPSTPTNQD